NSHSGYPNKKSHYHHEEFRSHSIEILKNFFKLNSNQLMMKSLILLFFFFQSSKVLSGREDNNKVKQEFEEITAKLEKTIIDCQKLLDEISDTHKSNPNIDLFPKRPETEKMNDTVNNCITRQNKNSETQEDKPHIDLLSNTAEMHEALTTFENLIANYSKTQEDKPHIYQLPNTAEMDKAAIAFPLWIYKQLKKPVEKPNIDPLPKRSKMNDINNPDTQEEEFTPQVKGDDDLTDGEVFYDRRPLRNPNPSQATNPKRIEAIPFTPQTSNQENIQGSQISIRYKDSLSKPKNDSQKSKTPRRKFTFRLFKWIKNPKPANFSGKDRILRTLPIDSNNKCTFVPEIDE
ncbi:MAG: hypothetical protein OXE99_15395, partial [Cellvibrionales bacterium]|nr:hypothetical protein [Cellvibrionales bacterium]